MPSITFRPFDLSVEVPPGENLLRGAMSAGVHINASCGGQGACGKCRVRILAGQVEGGLSERLSSDEVADGYRLACKALVYEDVLVEVPVESRLDDKLMALQKPKHLISIKRASMMQRLSANGEFKPLVEMQYLEMPPPGRNANQSDLGRLVRSLEASDDLSDIDIDLSTIKNLPQTIRDGDMKVTATLALGHSKHSPKKILDVVAGNRIKENYGLAVDIGTTTVYGQLVDLNDGSILGEWGEYNSQIYYGEDVISRILFAIKGDGQSKMQSLAVGDINRIIAHLVDEANIDPGRISVMVAAGNTTMTQLFLGINPKYIRLSPFVPTATLLPPVKAVDLGLNLEPRALVYTLPSVASYVGGDIVGGVLASNMFREEPLTLFIDIGTNGEIVIGNQDWMACAACSAGPAFEGGGVEHGMRAAPGAIDDFSINPVTYEPMITTIDQVRPKGICGTGLINIVAALFEAGVINNRGRFRTDHQSERLRHGDSGMEYVLAWAEETAGYRDIEINEVDIDNFLRAKGAMYAGYTALLESVGLSMDAVERVIIGGGFGQYINLERAIMVGLLPEMPSDRFSFIGNSSLDGARLGLLSHPLWTRLGSIVGNITNFELSDTPSYMDYYMGALFLPHTDMNRFPGVMGQINSLHAYLNQLGVDGHGVKTNR